MTVKFARLTRSAVRSLVPGKKITEHAITAEKLANRDVRYTVNVMVDAQRIHRVLGTESEGVTREHAERLIEKFRTEAREGRLSLPSRRKLQFGFVEAADKYIKRLEASGGKNIQAKRQHLRDHLKPYFKQQRIDRLTDFDINQYRKHRSDADASDATINREMSSLSHMLRSARAWKWIKADDIPQIVKTKEDQTPMFVLTDEQAAALMAGAIDDQDGLTWLFVAFGLNAAMRHREILGARFDQVNHATLRIFVPLAKAGSREQPITAELAHLIAEQQKKVAKGSEWIFPTASPGRSKSPHRTRMARQFARAVVRAGLSPEAITPHTMRRTAITKLITLGVDLPTVQRISGHKTMTMVLRYFHAVGSHVDKAAGLLGFGISGPVTQELHFGENSRGSNASTSAQNTNNNQ